MSVNLIVAVDQNFAIGYKNELLFKLKKDMKHFRETTLNSFCLMGKNTFKSLPSPLKNRRNVVLTRDINYKIKHPDVIIEHDLKHVLHLYKESGLQDKELFIIGGQSIYEQSLPYVDNIYLTFIGEKAEKKDTYFPMIDIIKDFKIVDSKYDCEDNVHFNILKFERRDK